MTMLSFAVVLSLFATTTTNAFTIQQKHHQSHLLSNNSNNNNNKKTSALFVSIGLGPEKDQKQQQEKDQDELIPGEDYEVPDHEQYRLSRRSKIDERCDEWFGKLIGDEIGILGSLATRAKERLLTRVPLKNEKQLPNDHVDFTPYVTTRLPWTPLVPAFGLEQYGLPIPRRNAETWRHFDVAGMVEQDYSGSPKGYGTILDDLSEDEVSEYEATLRTKGGWLDDDACAGRLVYINGRFAPQLSKTRDAIASNLNQADDELSDYLSRLTDGFTDELVKHDESECSSYQKLSGPNHNVGDPTSQFAINTQQGTACFAALNTLRTGAVAYIRCNEETSLPVLIVNAIKNEEASTGIAMHPRTLVIAEENSRLSFVQSTVDLDDNDDVVSCPKLYNGYTQVFIKKNANVTHSYLAESGGIVTSNVETDDASRRRESSRAALKDTHLEALDVHLAGTNAAYSGTSVSIGGTGRVRLASSVTLLSPGASCNVNGFSLSGGLQRTDMKTNIHHVAHECDSVQLQKNLIGGRAIGSFRGRIRVEQPAQLTDSQQLSRTILLSDKSRAWAVPSLEIIADDVQCTHGATVSDLSEEELFYLRSRGLNPILARNMLMYAFANDVTCHVDPSVYESLEKRVVERLENLVPRSDRAIQGEFQSI